VQVARLLNLMGIEALKIYYTLSIAETDTVETSRNNTKKV